MLTSEQDGAVRRLSASRCRHLAAALILLGALGAAVPSPGQTLAILQGRVLDASEAALAGALITVRNGSTGFVASAAADREGRYYVPALPAGAYRVTAEAAGFRSETIESLQVDAGRVLVRDFRLAVRDRHETVLVRAEVPLIDPASSTVAHVVTAQTVRQIPLNGRHFIDLGLLVPGSVAPSQTGFSSRPIRGVGALALNIAGNREEAVGFVVNGVTSNNLTFGSLIFEPPIGSIREFNVESSAFGAEHGHVSGAIVNIVTRSGTDDFRGDLFEFVRNDAFDARNFFELTSSDPNRFQRHQFGGSLGGPVVRGRTFFFSAYEGFRQRQGIDLNSLVLSDQQRAAATHPIVRQLIPLIPRANFFDADGTPRFVGSALAVVDRDRWTIDLTHQAGDNDRLHAFYGASQVVQIEPGYQGTSIPGFGMVARPFTSLLTIAATHIFGSPGLNEARFGRARLRGGTYPATTLNPADFGIGNGVTRPIGLPQMNVAGSLTFGGPGTLPMGRYDTSYVFADTFTRARGRHSIRLGGEYRHFVNDNFAEGTGIFNFPTVAAFLSGTANAFSITLGHRRSVIDQRAASLFFQHRMTIRNDVTVELGVRWEWHVTPTERNDAFVVFDAASGSLLRVGVDRDAIYTQNNRNVEPRLGIAWDVTSDGRTVLRAAYARTADQPGTTAVRDTAGNPPFAVPLTASGSIAFGNAVDIAQPAGLAPFSIDPRFRNASLHSWNVSLQRQIAPGTAVTAGYRGSRGTDLRIARNLNQPIGGVRPFAAVSESSPILPGAPLGNITQVESSGFSRYTAAWTSITRRLSGGWHLDASYTWSKSLDTNSLNSAGFAIQDSYDIAGQYGPSDFDARHRFAVNATWALPFTGHALVRGWTIAAVVQSQSGNPVNIVTTNSGLNGTANTVRPDLTGPIRIVGSVDRWFDPSAFAAVDRFGNLTRNAVTGPAFHNTDLSVSKHTSVFGSVALQVRADVFDLFNHPNFGPPGNIVGTPTFGKITRTRLPTGEAGSSRQVQLAATLSF